MSSSELFGWDLLYKTIEGRIVRQEDIIIALAHWFLIRHFNFGCIGVGDDKTLNENDVGSELLPDGWNESDQTYALRYVFNGNLYILLAAKTEDTIVMNLLDVKSRNVSNLALNPKETVKALRGSIKTMVPRVSELLSRFRTELVDPVFSGNSREVTTQTQTQVQPQPERYIPPPHLPGDPFGIPSPGNPLLIPSGRRDPLRDIGRGDLDPLGRGGGGMIFSPPPGSPFGGPPGVNPGQFPPGVRFPPPPGARFDPFGPPDPERNIRPNPNPNHFRPPPDFDDMYM